MTAKTPVAPVAPAAPVTAELARLRSAFALSGNPTAFAAAFPARPAPVAKARTARDWTRDVDLAIILAAGELVNELVPAEHRVAVAALVANQLHHLSTPSLGWPTANLPVPARSEWK